MKARLTALAAGMALVLTACGGGSNSTTAGNASPKAVAPVAVGPASSASAPAAPQSKTVLIEVNGDDAMLGVTSNNNGFVTISQQSEPADTQALLRAQFGDGITIVNHAEGGRASTLVNMMNGVDGGGPPFAQRMLTSKADIVLVNHAINDDLSQSLAPYADALVAWVQAVRAAGKIAVLEEPNPVCDANHPHLENYVSTMDGIATQYNVPIVKQFDYIQTLPNWQTHLSACLYPDEWLLHIKAQQEANVLAPIVQQLITPSNH
jgi:hypothetical protein